MIEFVKTKALSYLYLFVITVVFLGVYPKVYEDKVFLGGDNAAYYLLGKSIANGEGYVNSHIANGKEANHFPPGYSFVIGVILNITDGDIDTIKTANGFFLYVSLIFMFLIALRLSRNKHFSFAVTLFTLLNYHVLQYSSIVMSEMLFLCLVLIAFYSFLRWPKKEADFWKSPWFYVLLVSVILAIYTRTHGYVLLGLWLVWGVINKRWKSTAIGVALVVIAMVPWQMRTAKLGGSGYSKQLTLINPYNSSLGQMKGSDWGVRLKENAVRYFGKEIPNGIFPGYKVNYTKDKKGNLPPLKTSNYILGTLLLLLIVIGAWLLKEWRWFILVFLGGNLAVFLLWPDVWYGVRFMFCTIPILTILVFYSAYELIAKLFSKMPVLSSGTWLGLFVLPFMLLQKDKVSALIKTTDNKYGENWGNYMSLAEWSDDNLVDSAVVVCRKPHLFAMESNKKTTSYLNTEDKDLILEDFKSKGVTHVVVESLGFSSTAKYLYPAIQKYPGKFKLVKKFDPLELRKKKNPEGYKNAKSTGAFLFEFLPALGYEGGFNEEGKKSGLGRFEKFNGVVFKGMWKNDKLNGEVELIDDKSRYFKGNFTDGKRNGAFQVIVPKKGEFELLFDMDKVIKQKVVKLDTLTRTDNIIL